MITLAPVISWRPSSLTPLTSPPAQKIVIPALSLSFPLSLCHSRSLSVIPTKVGIQKVWGGSWIPAFARMTNK